MGKIIAIANQKGGVGKTTTAINLAACVAILEKKVLLIDFDPQGNATSGVGVTEDQIESTIYDCLIHEIDTHDAIMETSTPNLDIIPSNINLVGAELDLVNMFQREFKLKAVLDQIKDEYDYIFIDCLPSLGLITINALAAADSVIVPTQCEIFALEGLSKIKNTIELVKNELNPNLTMEGIVLSMYDSRLRLANVVVNEVQNHSTDPVFDTVIHRNSKIGEAPNVHLPIVLYDAGSKGASNFLNLAYEFLAQNDDLMVPHEKKARAKA